MKILFLSFFIFGCNLSPTRQNLPLQINTDEMDNALINPEGGYVCNRILLPSGFNRSGEDSNSYGNYLRHINLKPHGAEVYLFDGKKKENQNAHIAVLDVSVGKADLQQCADAVIRLRADYLRAVGRYEDISFNFTNGFSADYSKWRKGNGISVQSSYCKWVPSPLANQTEESYQLYLQKVFSYAGSLSLSKQLKSVPDISKIKVGDIWIRGGSPGHAAIVMDVAQNREGKIIFLLAQSYMPAQNIHILRNPENAVLSPWYSIDEISNQLMTPEYTFLRSELKRFD